MTRFALLLMIHALLAGTVRAGEPPVVAPGGERLDWAEVASGRPTVVLVIKGDWCPACRGQLESLAGRSRDLQATGGRVVALSADGPERNGRLGLELGLPFSVFDDPGGRFLQQHGLWLEEAGHPAPGLVLLDACGEVVGVRAGRTPGLSQDELVLRALRRLVREPSPCGGLEV